jgi:hypothetical protein
MIFLQTVMLELLIQKQMTSVAETDLLNSLNQLVSILPQEILFGMRLISVSQGCYWYMVLWWDKLRE